MEGDIVTSGLLPDEHEKRRVPSRPPSQASLLSRKRKSLDDESYMEVDLKSKEMIYAQEYVAELHPPKAFRQTQSFLGFNFGRWRTHARHGSVFCIVFVAVFVPLYYATLAPASFNNIIPGPFEYDCSAKTGWLGIDMRFGKFSYGEAKAIDLMWNWFVGRGVQAILSLIAYRVFTDALLRAAEMTHLSYELYASLSLYSSRMIMAWQLLKNLGKNGNWRTKTIFLWLIFSTIYLLAFPSLLDICSGYEASYTTNIMWPNGTLSNAADYQLWFWNQTVANSTTLCINQPNHQNPSNFSFTYESLKDECDSSRWLQVWYWQEPFLNDTWWAQFYQDPLSLEDSSTWGQWYFYPSMTENYKCIPDNGVYQWGFSSEWLMVAAIINSAWLIGLWGLWLDCDLNSELCKKRRRLGLWRAVADISEAMREELGPNICAYDEWELAEALHKKPPVKYYAYSGEGSEPGHIGLSARRMGSVKLEWDHVYGGKEKDS